MSVKKICLMATAAVATAALLVGCAPKKPLTKQQQRIEKQRALAKAHQVAQELQAKAERLAVQRTIEAERIAAKRKALAARIAAKQKRMEAEQQRKAQQAANKMKLQAAQRAAKQKLMIARQRAQARKLAAERKARQQQLAAQRLLKDQRLMNAANQYSKTTKETASQVVNVKFAKVSKSLESNNNTEVFMELLNQGQLPHAIVAASSPIASKTQLHTIIYRDNQASMQQVAYIPIPKQGETDLQLGGLHIMLFGLKRQLNTGQTVPITLVFNDGSSKTINATVS